MPTIRFFRLLCALVLLSGAASADAGDSPAPDAVQACIRAAAAPAPASRQQWLTRIRASHAPAEVPASVRWMFGRIVQAAGHFALGGPPELHGFRSPQLGAFALENGMVFVSSALWNGSRPLADDEIAAVLAHEIAHVARADGVRRRCEYAQLLRVDWLDAQQLKGEMERRIWSGATNLAIGMFAVDHQREYQADALGIQLLAQAGIDPQAMERMLLRLAAQGGYSGPSHPDLLSRIEAVRALTGGMVLGRQ